MFAAGEAAAAQAAAGTTAAPADAAAGGTPGTGGDGGGDGLVVRTLEKGDFDKGFLQLLAQLTTVGDVSREQFEARWQELQRNPDYHIAVVEDTTASSSSGSGRLLGTAALIVERKFIHACGKVGHVEDVVVDAAARGKRLGQRLIAALVEAARAQGAYKVILDCAEHNVAFYERCGLSRKEVQMVRYL